jgi:branched-chain amino acid transport system ATP-binding protein
MTSTSAGGTEVSELLLRVDGLNAHYGRAHVLHDVGFELRADEPVAIIGRNGMGKTTLCKAIVGIAPPAAHGSVRIRGDEALGRPSYRVAGAGVGYVPQGRRLFSSLSTEEHLKMLGRRNGGGRWTIGRVYELFPRLRERRSLSAGQLSGGEQQMLAIGRALLTNPTLLIMDEPSEGLAPTIIESLVDACRGLIEEGIVLLLIEQNLGVATALCRRQLVMVAGTIAAETTAEELLGDPEAQLRYLGVTRVV